MNLASSGGASSLRILVHNILEGFRPVQRDDERRRIDRQRLAAAQRLVARLAPDIYILNEALYCLPHGERLTDYGGLFGFPHQAGALYDGEWGNVVLSRHPIVASEELRIYNRGGLRVLIETPAGGLTVASYHPHPQRLPANKASDFEALVAGVTGRLAVCGDFNAVSPEDVVDEAALIEGFSRFSATPADDVARFMASGREVFRVLAAHGLRDAVPRERRRYTMPSDLLSTDKRSAMRLDHVFVSRGISVLDGEVVQDAETNRISDHHPVRVDLRLDTPGEPA